LPGFHPVRVTLADTCTRGGSQERAARSAASAGRRGLAIEAETPPRDVDLARKSPLSRASMPPGRERDVSATYDLVRSSFGPNAAKYTHSHGHADTEALARLVAGLAPRRGDWVLDVGAGAGQTGLAFAAAVARVVALDLTREMLQETRLNAAARGIRNLAVQQGGAEALPFDAGSFDIVVCRRAAHHFAAPAQAVLEMARVLRPGGRLAIVDTMVPEDDEIDRQINAIERLRDPSHVRDRRPSEWRALVTGAGLAVADMEIGYYDAGSATDLDAWTARIGTTPENVAELRRLLQAAAPPLAETLKIELDGAEIHFALPRLTLVAVK